MNFLRSIGNGLMGGLGAAGRGLAGAGRGILNHIDNAALNSATSGGLLDDALGGKFTPTPEQKRAMRGQYLQGIFGAMAQDRPVGEGIAQYQQNIVGQVQTSRAAQQQAQQRATMGQFQQEMNQAGTVEQKFGVLEKYSGVLGPAAVGQYADALRKMHPAPVQKKATGAPYVRMKDGKPMMYRGFDDGTEQELGPPPPDLGFDGTGRLINKSTGQVVTEAPPPKPTLGQVMGTNEGYFRINPDNTGTPITGPNGKTLMPPQRTGAGGDGTQRTPPSNIVKSFTDNLASIRVIDDALKELEANPTATGWEGMLPDYIANRMDHAGAKARSAIANVGSLQIKNRTGAVMTKAEEERLLPFIPGAKDDLQTVRMKLTGLREQVLGINDDMRAAYGDGVGMYAPLPPRGQQIGGGGRGSAGPVTQPVAPKIRRFNPETGRFE